MSSVDNYLNANSTAARLSVAGSIDTDPEEASRAIELGDETGAPSSAIYGDVDGFEQRHKTQLASQIIDNSRFVADYINSHPLAANLSHDDLGNLSQAGDSLSRLTAPGAVHAASRYLTGGLSEAATGFKEGFGTEPVGSWMGPEYWLKYPASAGVMNAITGVPEIGLRGVSGLVRGLSELVRTRISEGADAAGLNGEQLSRDIAGMVEAEAMGMSGRHGMPSPEMVSTIRGAVEAAKPYIESGKMPPTGVHPFIDSMYKAAAEEDAKLMDEAVRDSAKSATRERSADFFAKFAEGPVGDATIKVDANAIARLYGDSRPEADDGILGWVPNLADRLDATAGSGGYIDIPLKDWAAKIDPDVYKELRDDVLVRDHGFTVNEAKEVEEPKVEQAKTEPTTDANTEVAELENQLAKLREFNNKAESVNQRKGYTGRDDPEFIKDQAGRREALVEENDLADKINDLKNKTKDVSEDWTPPGPDLAQLRTIPDPVSVVRGSAGLEPLFSHGDRKITLQRAARDPKSARGYITPLDRALGQTGFHDFDIADQDGNKIGSLNLSEQHGGKQLYVEMIQAGSDAKMYSPNYLGPGLIRDLFRQIKAEFPKAFGPDGMGLTGHRVSGAREKAGSYELKSAMPVVRMAVPEDVEAFRKILFEGQQSAALHPETMAWFRPPEDWTSHEHEIAQAIQSEFNRILPRSSARVVDTIDEGREGTRTQAMYLPDARNPAGDMSIFTLMSKDHLGDVHHEAIHQLRRGFFTHDEWDTLKSAALENNWHEKYGIEKHYSDATPDIQIEESIAEAFRNWMNAPKEVPDAIHPIFAKLKEFFDTIKDKIGKILGRGFSWDEIFQKVDSGEVGAREQGHDVAGSKLVRQESLASRGDDGVDRINIRLPFGEGKAIGIRQDIYQRYMKLIRDRHDSDLQADFASALKDEKRSQTKEWKENASAIRDQVTSELDEKPNVLVDRLLSEKGGSVKIDPMSLREDLREALPKDYMRRTNSMSADELAPHFGYPSGDAMVEHLAELAADRKASGLSHGEYVERMVDSEVERRMESQYGYLEKNVLEDAKDRALSQNQIDILAEETLALAEASKQELPLSRGAMTAELRKAFDATPVGAIKSDLWLKAAGKAGKEAEEALVKDDPAEAFKAKQRQWNATQNAQWALQYEKARKSLDKTAKRFAKREAPTAVEPEFVNHIQDQLRRAGYPTRRSWENIREGLGTQTLEQFVSGHLADSYGYLDLPAPEFMLDPRWEKAIDQMPHEDFMQYKGAIDALNKVGREIRKYGREGEKRDLEEALTQAIGQVKTFDAKQMEYGDEPGLARTFLARSTSMFTVFNRLDRGDRRGFFNQLGYRFAQGDNESAAMERKVVDAWKELGDYGDFAKKMSPPPMMTGWKYPSFTRQNLLGLIQNAGNKSNWFKAAKGWGVENPQELLDWVHQNSTREDWVRAQKMGDGIFNKMVADADKVQERVTGYTIDKIPLEPMEIDFGDGEAPLTLKGWYHPLMPDQIWYADKQKVRGGAFDDSNFGHIMTSNGYTRTRTGAVYPVDLGFASLPNRLSQMIHDITHREVVLDAQKIMKNPRFLNAMTEHYGKEYADLMVPYLRGMAGQQAMPSANWARMEQFSEFMRGNAMATYIGFNPSTPMKHAPTAFFMSLRAGGMDFLKAYKQQFLGEKAADGNTWSDYAMKNSEELQRRERNWQDTFGGNDLRLNKDSTVRENIRQAGQWMVAKSDMFSAKALWIGSFQKALREDPNIRDAIDLANADVKRQHGSTAPSNKPEIVRQSGSLHGWMTSVYGFMGERLQRMIETTQKINDTYGMVKDGQLKQATRQLPGILADYATYMVSVGLWEEAATAALSGDHESGGYRLFKLMFGNIASSLVYLRDMYHAVESGQSPSMGMLPSAAGDLVSPFRDVHTALDDAKKGRSVINKQHAGKYIHDLMSAVGIATGAFPKVGANILQFSTNVYNRQEHPKDVKDWFRGLVRGHLPKKESK